MQRVVFVLLCVKTFVACYDVTVKINGVDIPVRKTTEGGYSGTYNFFSGGYADFACRYTGVKTDLLLLSSNAYESANITSEPLVQSHYDSKPSDTELYDSRIYLYLQKLSAEHDGKYIECYVSEESRLRRSSVTRIYLAITDKKPDFGVIINDLIVPTVHCPYDFEFKKEGLCYDYFYYAGENIIIKSYQNDRLYGNMICKSSYGDFTPTSSINFTGVLANTSGIMQFNATCEPASNEGAHPVHILITFVQKLFVRARNDNVGLQMYGISLSRTLAAFDPSNSSSIALYEYHDDDVLHLKCNSYSRYTESVSLLWKYDARISVKNAGSESNSISGDFKLDASRKTGVVSCIIKRNDNSTESWPYIGIILVRRQ